MTEKDAYVAFNLTEQVGAVTVARLAARFGGVVEAWEKHPLKVARTGGDVDWEAEYAKAAKFGVKIITPADEGYPRRLLEQPGHPLALYVKGDVAALSKPSVALVGTRRATAYGLDQAGRFARALAEAGWSIVSGLAVGIDAASHAGALAAGGTTVGVIGSGLDRFYPEENRALAREIVKNGGAVVSEFPFGRPPDAQTFPQRNHVVAALAAGVLCIEAPAKSGTLITASIAADMGRTVMAIPGRVDSPSCSGCLSLIRDGARLVRSPKDVESELASLAPLRAPDGKKIRRESAASPVPVPEFSIEESIIMRNLDEGGTSMDSLVERTKLPAAKVNSVCMTLRMKGRIRFLPGNRVAALKAE